MLKNCLTYIWLLPNWLRRRQWHPTPALLPGKSHGWRSLVGCSPWGLKELDTTERLHFHFSLSCFGEGNVKPLQCSCLENPRDGGAWWAAVYGVSQSRTRLSDFAFTFNWLLPSSAWFPEEHIIRQFPLNFHSISQLLWLVLCVFAYVHSFVLISSH